MYKVLGTDNQEYGPVPAETILQWIAEGRADASTQIRRADSADWRPLADFAEFASAIHTPVSTPPPITPPPYADLSTLLHHSLARSGRIDPFFCISRGWKLVTQHFWLTVGACFIGILISAPFSNHYAPIPLRVIGVLLNALLAGGLYTLFLKLVRGQPASLGDMFAGFQRGTLQLILAVVVQFLFFVVGFVLCVLPFIYLLVAYCLTTPLIMDKNLDFWPAMETGRKIITKQWWTFFGLCLLILLVFILGILACVVGIFVAIPVIYAATAYAYEDLFGAGAPAQTQQI